MELHVYQTGGHGFGIGRPGSTNGMMVDQFMTTLAMKGFIGRDQAGRAGGEQ